MRTKKFLAIGILSSILMMMSGVVAPSAVLAQTSGGNVICTIFPFISSLSAFGGDALCGTGDTTTAVSATANVIRFAVSLIFIVIIIIAVFVVIKSALKYIQSEGDESKIQEAQKAIKNVFIGIAALFIGIIGIVIVLAFFSASGAIGEVGGELPGDIGVDDLVG